jgi:hypothetical protein
MSLLQRRLGHLSTAHDYTPETPPAPRILETYPSLPVTGKSSAKPVPVCDPTVAEDLVCRGEHGPWPPYISENGLSGHHGIRVRGGPGHPRG